MPIVAWLFARFVVQLEGIELFAVVLLSALPTAQNIFNYAQRYERGEIIARDTILLTTLGAIPVALLIAVLLS
jgi:predicted permease